MYCYGFECLIMERIENDSDGDGGEGKGDS